MYLSFVIGQLIKDPHGNEIGRLTDLIVSPSEHLPVVSAVRVKTDRTNEEMIAWRCFSYDEQSERFSLAVSKDDIVRYEVGEEDLLLRTNVMDKQIVDVHDYRVVRVNDIRIEPSSGRLYLVGVDTGTRGLLRRMGLMHVADRITKSFSKIKILSSMKLSSHIIGWHDVEAFERGVGRLKLKVTAARLSALHPSDIARIVNELDPDQRNDVMETLDVETAAEVLSEAHPEVQASIVENLEEELAADLLEEMDPDEAADILGDVSAEKREDILDEMEPEDAEDVIELLAYDENTAGGLMTTEYVAVSKDSTAGEVILRLRELAPEAELVYYIYVLDSSEHLVGVVSLRDIIISPEDRQVSEIMVDKVVHVHLDGDMEEIVQKISDYNLLALPVVDEENRMQGIITFDDVLEEIVPEDWRKRVPRLWH